MLGKVNALFSFLCKAGKPEAYACKFLKAPDIKSDSTHW